MIFYYFLNRFKKALIEFQKTEGQKNLELEIKSSNEELKGISFHFYNIKKSKFKEIFDQTKDYIKKSLFVISFSFNSSDENIAKSIEDSLKKIASKNLQEFLKSKDFEIDIKRLRKKININICISHLNNIFILLLEEILNLFEFIKFDCYFKAGFSVEDFFYSSFDELKSGLVKFCLLIKSQPDVLNVCLQILEEIKFANDKYEKKLKTTIQILNNINSKEISTQILNLISEILTEDNIKIFQFYLYCFAKGFMEKNELIDYLQGITLDEITVYFQNQKYENGLMINFNLPGFSKVLNDEKMYEKPLCCIF